MKNKTLRNIKALMLKFQRRQQQGTATVNIDKTEHTCPNCGTKYVGRYCPQCSMPSSWQRFTARMMFFNILDMWGLGNRPIKKTATELLWRPGYMIREYLAGHYLVYFPPFRMLVVLLAVFAALIWIFGLQMPAESGVEYTLNLIEKEVNDPHSHNSWIFLKKVGVYIDDHRLQSIILQNILVIFAVWLVFRRKSNYGLIETTYALIYINCQFVMFSIIWMIVTQQIPVTNLYPYAVPNVWMYLWLYIDFRQLYGLSFWQTILRIFLVTLILLTIYVCLIIALPAILLVH